MQATLHLPGAPAGRPLTQAEVATLDLSPALQPRNVAALRQLFGTDVPAEPLAALAGRYAIVAAENAADYGFGPAPSAEADFVRLTGVEPDEPLLGPMLIIEA